MCSIPIYRTFTLFFSVCASSDCSDFFSYTYGDMVTLDVPRDAEFLEFSTGWRGSEQVLWNRTDPQTNRGSRGKLRHNAWEITMVTHSDGGFYNLRRKDNSLINRIQLEVEGEVKNLFSCM